MYQLGKVKSILFHLYPGIIITVCFVLLTPFLIRYHYPPQFSLLIAILVAAIPTLFTHLFFAKKNEKRNNIWDLNGFTNKLPIGKLILYSTGIVALAFLIWGITQPLNKIITEKIFGWLPSWYRLQDFTGYDKEIIRTTLFINLFLNGLIAPFAEELYFRGYLLPRMKTWGKWSFFINALLFSLYHFWQPYIYLTLILSLLPMAYLVSKTKDIRVGILSHCLLNLLGAVLSFGLLLK